MFIWDFAANPVMEAILDWCYSQMVGFLGALFAQMGGMGVELFELSWVQSVVRFFSQLGWALFAVSVVVSAFECGIEYASGRGNLQQPALNALKGFFAVSLFTTVPVRLYALSVSLQGTFAMEITGAGKSIGELGAEILADMEGAGLLDIAAQAKWGLGLMLAAGEVPRIAGAFGLDTTTRANIMSAVYTAQAAVNTTRTIVQAVK